MLRLAVLIVLLQPAASWAQRVVSLSDLGGRIDSDARTTRLTINNELIIFEPGSPFFKVGNEIFQLVSPAVRKNNTTWVPDQFVTEWLTPRHPAPRTAPASRDPRPTPESVPATATTTAPSPAMTTRVVIVDAGHGGIDAGKVGPNGVAEKNVTLSVAHKLAAMLKERGYEVHVTRTSDTLIALADRPRFANQWKNSRPATLFVSIHANAGAVKAQGFETYFLSEARTEDERRVAEMENAVVSFEKKSAAPEPAIEQVLNGLRNDYYQHASNDLAEVIQRELGAFHPGPGRGVKQAGFRVLVGALMPAVLVEIGFISNPDEAHLLGTAAFQDKIAWSLARSINNFFESHEHLWADTK
jgi:N-acetylmuramoyl-L-alanine amidase